MVCMATERGVRASERDFEKRRLGKKRSIGMFSDVPAFKVRVLQVTLNFVLG